MFTSVTGTQDRTESYMPCSIEEQPELVYRMSFVVTVMEAYLMYCAVSAGT
jgi:hypothetical protein